MQGSGRGAEHTKFILSIRKCGLITVKWMLSIAAMTQMLTKKKKKVEEEKKDASHINTVAERKLSCT